MAGPNITLQTPVVATRNQVSSDLGDDVVILDLNAGFYHGLNATGGRIWKLVQQSRTPAEIRNTLLDEFEVDAARCQRDVLATLQEFMAKGLVEIDRATAGPASQRVSGALAR